MCFFFECCIRGACCCCQSLCNNVCRSLKSIFVLSIRQQMRLAYISLFFLFTLLTLISMYEIPSWLGIFSTFIHCPSQSSNPDDNLACLGVSALYRMSLSLVTLFSILLLVCLLRNELSKFINENFWIQKIVLLIVLFIVQMWVPNYIYSYYGTISKLFGILFSLFQTIMCIDLFYSWSENWVKNVNNGITLYEYLLYIFSFGLYGLTAYFIYQNYNLFPCSNQQNAINIVIVVGISIINLSPINYKPSLLVSGAVSLMITYQNWSALTNIQSSKCNQYAVDQGAFIKIEGVIGVFFIILSLGYITFGSSDENSKSNHAISQSNNIMASMRKNELEDDSDDDDFIIAESGYFSGVDLEQDALDMSKIEKRNAQKNQQGQDQINNQESAAQLVKKELKRQRELRQIKRMRDYKTNTYIYFHLIMVFSSFYIVTLLTNYGAIQIDQKINWSYYQTSQSSKDIKLGISYFTAFIYIWTIVAPHIFPSREF